MNKDENGKIVVTMKQGLPTAADRIGHEVKVGFQAVAHIDKAIAVFGGARIRKGTRFWESAHAFAKEMSNEGFAIVTGGGPGIMEAANSGAKAGEKSLSIGLNILLKTQRQNSYQDMEINFSHFASRKVTFCRVADAFVVYPGGFGTLDELGEILTLIQTGKMDKVPVLLVGKDFWKPFSSMFDNMLEQQLVSPEDKKLYEIVDENDVAKTLLRLLATKNEHDDKKSV